jgi:hypothetical protein
MDQIFPFLPLAIFAYFGWRYFRNGSLVGALLGSRIIDPIGEVDLAPSGMVSRVLRVATLAPTADGSPDVALSITSKAKFGASLVPFRLSRSQAQQLIELLQRATAN